MGEAEVLTTAKFDLLNRNIRGLLPDGLIIAFSGGVDSSFLLLMASQILNEMKERSEVGKLLALTTVSPSIPTWEIEEAKNFARSLHVEHVFIESEEVEQEAYKKNDGTRCYHCKSELFKIAATEIKKRDFRHIAYGYNASDRLDVRLGHKASLEFNILSPLNDANLQKFEIRNYLKSKGLSLADKPASPCLASRVMTGVRVTTEKLRDIEKMESILREASIKNYRVRLHEEKTETKSAGYFRIEVDPSEILAVVHIKDDLLREARVRGYRWVTLDLGGYKMGGANF